MFVSSQSHHNGLNCRFVWFALALFALYIFIQFYLASSSLSRSVSTLRSYSVLLILLSVLLFLHSYTLFLFRSSEFTNGIHLHCTKMNRTCSIRDGKRFAHFYWIRTLETLEIVQVNTKNLFNQFFNQLLPIGKFLIVFHCLLVLLPITLVHLANSKFKVRIAIHWWKIAVYNFCLKSIEFNHCNDQNHDFWYWTAWVNCRSRLELKRSAGSPLNFLLIQFAFLPAHNRIIFSPISPALSDVFITTGNSRFPDDLVTRVVNKRQQRVSRVNSPN